MSINTKSLLAEVQANLRALDGCPGPHLFRRIEPEKFGTKYRCDHCGGTVTGPFVNACREGIKHAGGDPAEVTVQR
ncbi:hypothetical protein [Azospirillum brasilense]|uniref:Uncharacterized protein n=1 Tax=Azospirillum brasilense TaxID=192 RepID=A0A235H9T1_AZOBR|nr:hypothetical protein [Azospirillum brasilense]OYD82492.1 hypothetical protein CHT98_20035 [Azospirillum brasilense]